MRRLVIRIFVFLLLGAIVNVAVAWAFRDEMYPEATQPLLDSRTIDRIATRYGLTALPEDECFHYEFTGFEFEYTVGSLLVVHEQRRIKSVCQNVVAGSPSGPPLIEIVESGWPWHSLVRSRSRARVGLTMSDVESWHSHDQFKFKSDHGGFQILPLRPIWPGFAINTVFYAALLWLLFATPFALRHRRRIRYGLCPKCAYPVGTSDVCTECGTALTRRS